MTVTNVTQISSAINSMIRISAGELEAFLGQCTVRRFPKQGILSEPTGVPQEIFFLNSGLIRVLIQDKAGVEHTIHFALENQFIADYSSFIRQQPSLYTLKAVEETEAVVIPRSAIEWGYEHLAEGQKLGRLIAEYYFVYQDHRIQNLYDRTPKERYDSMTDVFPNIHNRVPQRFIASYLGISPVHLSRLKKADYLNR